MMIGAVSIPKKINQTVYLRWCASSSLILSVITQYKQMTHLRIKTNLITCAYVLMPRIASPDTDWNKEAHNSRLIVELLWIMNISSCKVVLSGWSFYMMLDHMIVSHGQESRPLMTYWGQFFSSFFWVVSNIPSDLT